MFRLRNLINTFDFNATVIRLTGLMVLLSMVFPHLAYRANDFVTFDIVTLSRYVSILLGLSLFYLAAQISRKKQSAFWVTVIALCLLIVAEAFHFHGGARVGLYLVTLLLLLKDRRQYVVKSDVTSIRRACITALGVLFSLAVLCIMALQVINHRNFGHDLSVTQSFDILWRSLVGLPLSPDIHLSRFGERIVHLLHFVGLSSLLFIGLSLFQPVRLRRPASRHQRRLAENLVATYSKSSEDFFKLWPEDKHYFFYADSFVAYGVRRGVALVLDGPTGKPADRDQIRTAFLNEARRNGWMVAIVHADQAEAAAWQSLGLQSLYIGSEAVIKTATFVETTMRNKHFRYVRNKAARDGLSFEYWNAPLTTSQLRQLKTVSDAWLTTANRREYTFIMGYFDRSYLQRCDVGVVRKNGAVIAYTNLIPPYVTRVASVDHIRAKQGASQVSMHYLFTELIRKLSDAGIRELNLGLAPLARLDKQTRAGLPKGLLSLIKSVGSRYYSTAGVEQFKNKFEPDWQPRYLLYSGTHARLANVVSAINALTTFRQSDNKLGRTQKLLIGAAIVAAVGYGSFLLAYFFNRPYFWSGLVSGLTEPTQPYSWLFNSLDVVSSLLGIGIFGYLCWRHWNNRLYASVLGLAALASLAELMTDVYTLPRGFATTAGLPSVRYLVAHPDVFIHGAASFINSAAFVVSFGLWVYYRRRADKNGMLWAGILAVVVGIGTLGGVIGHLYPVIAPSLQRIFILCYCLWLVGLTADGLQERRSAHGPRIDTGRET